MPREQLLGLTAEVDRLLSAGAPAACGNDNLRRRSKTLRDLGKQVAALVPVADAVDRVVQATPKQAGPVFLNLIAVTRQIRASLTSGSVEGDLQPLASRGPWQTPLSVRELQPIAEALTKSGSGREAVLHDARDRKLYGDLRLVQPLLDAMGDGYAPVAELATEHGMTALGPAVVDDLRAQ